jgi:hypothetical protein
LFNNGTTDLIPLSKMVRHIPPPPLQVFTSDNQDALLPHPTLPLPQLVIHLQTQGSISQGLSYPTGWGVLVLLKSHVNKSKEDWGIPLPNLPTTWINFALKAF